MKTQIIRDAISEIIGASGLPCVETSCASWYSLVYNEYRLDFRIDETFQIREPSYAISVPKAMFSVVAKHGMPEEIGQAFRRFIDNPWAEMAAERVGRPRFKSTHGRAVPDVHANYANSQVNKYIAYKLASTTDFYNLYIEILKWAATCEREQDVFAIASKIIKDRNNLERVHHNTLAAIVLQR